MGAWKGRGEKAGEKSRKPVGTRGITASSSKSSSGF